MTRRHCTLAATLTIATLTTAAQADVSFVGTSYSLEQWMWGGDSGPGWLSTAPDPSPVFTFDGVPETYTAYSGSPEEHIVQISESETVLSPSSTRVDITVECLTADMELFPAVWRDGYYWNWFGFVLGADPGYPLRPVGGEGLRVTEAWLDYRIDGVSIGPADVTGMFSEGPWWGGNNYIMLSSPAGQGIDSHVHTITTQVIPEPATIGLLGAGLLTLVRRRG